LVDEDLEMGNPKEAATTHAPPPMYTATPVEGTSQEAAVVK